MTLPRARVTAVRRSPAGPRRRRAAPATPPASSSPAVRSTASRATTSPALPAIAPAAPTENGGDCLGDRVGDPHGPTRGFVLESLQLDASGCVGNPCDPSCQNFVDTASGVDAAVDSGLIWNDAGVSLVPIYADSGPACTGFTISPQNQTVTVTSIPKTTDPSTAVPTVTYGSGQQYQAAVTPSGCFGGVVPALWGMDRNDLGTLDSTTGLLTVFTASPRRR